MTERSLGSFFRTIDKDFIGLTVSENSEESEKVTFRTTETIVKKNLVFRVPVTAEKAVINYDFSTTVGKIMFCVTLTNDKNEMILLENKWYDSDIYEVKGRLESTSGLLTFTWENPHYWVSHVFISYVVEVNQDTFNENDMTRCKNSLRLFNEAIREKKSFALQSTQKDLAEADVQTTLKSIELLEAVLMVSFFV